jgi:hypothetical protein
LEERIAGVVAAGGAAGVGKEDPEVERGRCGDGSGDLEGGGRREEARGKGARDEPSGRHAGEEPESRRAPPGTHLVRLCQ